MAYTPDSDDAAAPLATAFASSAALEFRTLKSKVNQLFLLSNINTSENAVYSTKGIATVNSGGSGSELRFGASLTVERSAGTGSVIGASISAALANSLTLGGTAAVQGLLVQAFTGVTDSLATALYGANVVVVQRTAAGQDSVTGIAVKFQNRLSSLDAGAVVGGIGDDLFNNNSAAVRIQSQARSTETEKCGWARGIVFEASSLDEDDATGAEPIAIDFTGIATYDSSKLPVPFAFASGQKSAAAATNGGAVAMPTVLSGWIRINIGGSNGFAIPVCTLATI